MKKEGKQKGGPISKKTNSTQGKSSFVSWIPWLAGLLLAVSLAYSPVLKKEFINYDDGLYILDNPYVKNFNPKTMAEAFSKSYEEQYSPLATAACGIIYRISGDKPFLYNLAALLIHLANTLLAFWLVYLLLGKFYPALIAAAIFGMHAMNVETIAWAAASFKIGLYAMFFFLSVISYLKYCRNGKIYLLLLSLGAYLLSCFSKEQAVALPATLILIDYFSERKLLSAKVILEKIPFVLISLVFAYVALSSTAADRTGIESTPFSLADKITYSAQALTHYLFSMIAPMGLYLNYAIRPASDIGPIFYFNLLSFLFVAGGLIYFLIRKQRIQFFALGFFMSNILFALLLAVVSVRETITADRYIYVSSLAYGFMLGYGVWWIYEKRRKYLNPVIGVILVYLLILGISANNYAGTWKNSFTVMDNVIQHEPVQFALVNRGLWYKQHDQIDLALEDYNRAIRLYPEKYMAYINRGNIYFNQGKDSLASKDYEKVLGLNPRNGEVRANLGAIYTRAGRYEEALLMFDEALRLKPDLDNSWLNKAITLKAMKKYDESILSFREYLKFKPEHDGVYDEIGRILQEQGKQLEAIESFNKAIALAPDYGSFYQDRAFSYYNLKDYTKAAADVETAKRLGVSILPDFSAALEQILKKK